MPKKIKFFFYLLVISALYIGLFYFLINHITSFYRLNVIWNYLILILFLLLEFFLSPVLIKNYFSLEEYADTGSSNKDRLIINLKKIKIKIWKLRTDTPFYFLYSSGIDQINIAVSGSLIGFLDENENTALTVHIESFRKNGFIKVLTFYVFLPVLFMTFKRTLKPYKDYNFNAPLKFLYLILDHVTNIINFFIYSLSRICFSVSDSECNYCEGFAKALIKLSYENCFLNDDLRQISVLSMIGSDEPRRTAESVVTRDELNFDTFNERLFQTSNDRSLNILELILSHPLIKRRIKKTEPAFAEDIKLILRNTADLSLIFFPLISLFLGFLICLFINGYYGIILIFTGISVVLKITLFNSLKFNDVSIRNIYELSSGYMFSKGYPCSIIGKLVIQNSIESQLCKTFIRDENNFISVRFQDMDRLKGMSKKDPDASIRAKGWFVKKSNIYFEIFSAETEGKKIRSNMLTNMFLISSLLTVFGILMIIIQAVRI